MNRVRHSARRAVASVGLLLAACSSAPPVEWQANAKAALDRAVAAYLAGDTRVANTEFGLARRELASTGRADQVALAELTRCGVQVASLDIGPCEGFERLRADATPQERAYADYLANRMRPGDSALLPESQRMFAASRKGRGCHRRRSAKATDRAGPGHALTVTRTMTRGLLSPTSRSSPRGSRYGFLQLADDDRRKQHAESARLLGDRRGSLNGSNGWGRRSGSCIEHS
jgi:hypothetical protein